MIDRSTVDKHQAQLTDWLKTKYIDLIFNTQDGKLPPGYAVKKNKSPSQKTHDFFRRKTFLMKKVEEFSTTPSKKNNSDNFDTPEEPLNRDSELEMNEAFFSCDKSEKNLGWVFVLKNSTRGVIASPTF